MIYEHLERRMNEIVFFYCSWHEFHTTQIVNKVEEAENNTGYIGLSEGHSLAMVSVCITCYAYSCMEGTVR